MIKGCEMEKLLVVPISELIDVQVKCDKCQSLMTLPLDRTEHASLACSGCGNQLRRAGVDDALRNFANSLRYLQGSKFDMRFVLREDG